MPVYITLQKDINNNQNHQQTVAIQKCGNYPYEVALRFAGCNLQCGPCFAAGYAWQDRFLNNNRVRNNITVDRVLQDFENLPVPENGHYNWMRILGGEPLLNNDYIEFLFEFIKRASEINSQLFNNGIIIQTNGIFIGQGNTNLINTKLQELYKINPNVIVAIEISIKGTNPEEFNLITRSDENLFNYNINSYYELKNLDRPNLRTFIIAGYGISESYLLTEGMNPRSMITILFNENTPTFHPSIWSDEFQNLYEDFTSDWRNFDNMFNKMPMYGIKDQFNYGWVRPAIRRARQIYGNRYYDSQYQNRNEIIENKFRDILNVFFLKNNQEYYSTLIRHN